MVTINLKTTQPAIQMATLMATQVAEMTKNFLISSHKKLVSLAITKKNLLLKFVQTMSHQVLTVTWELISKLLILKINLKSSKKPTLLQV